MSILVGVVAHETRRTEATALAVEVDADVVSVDDGTLGCLGNHRRVWQWHADMSAADPDIDWCVVLEDDALPVPGFRDQLGAALAAAPMSIVSLYLGTDGRDHWQSRIRAAINDTSPGTCWIVSPAGAVLHAVGIAVRAELLPITLPDGLAPDAGLSNWAKRHLHPVAYTWPSLVNHADGPPVITQRGDPNPRDTPRRAHLTGSRDRWNPQLTVLN